MEKRWTVQDNQEMRRLSQKLFGNDMFKQFSEEEMQSEDYKKYDELVKRKQAACRRLTGCEYGYLMF